MTNTNSLNYQPVNHGVVVGGANATISSVGPSSTSGQVLQSAGASADPAFSTATYPSTTTSQQILYSTSNNTIGELTTANSKFPATNSSGTLAMRGLSVVIQTFTSNGTYTPTSGMQYCVIECVGSGGGGGGSAATTASQIAYAGAGGNGEYARGVFSASSIGASKAVTCPAGGAGGTAGNNNGTAGSTTSVGALISAAGGSGGSGAPATATNGSNAGGAGGTGGSGGSFRFKGAPGRQATYSFGVFTFTGDGMPGPFTGGTQGDANTGTGKAGTGYGGGGGGGQSFISAAAQAGGAGSSGLVVITEYVIA